MGSKKTILVLDDEVDLAKIVKYRLEKKGYNVLVAHDGLAGLKIAGESNPDLIVLDINMPKMGGLEFYKNVLTEFGHPKYPILVLTARGELKDLFKDIAADGFMSKPFEIEQLLCEVERIINQSSALSVFIMDFKESPHVQEMQKMFNKERYRVTVAETIEAFQSEAAKNKPDFIVMEYMQSSASFEEVIAQIKKYESGLAKEGKPPARIPVIVYSYSGFDYRDKSLKAGADRYLGKPATHEEFIRAIEELRLKERT